MVRQEPEQLETVEEARELLQHERFYTPVSELPDDPELLKEHIEELYIYLGNLSQTIQHLDQRVEEVTEEIKKESQESGENQKVVEEQLDKMNQNREDFKEKHGL